MSTRDLALALIREHIPDLTDEDEAEIHQLVTAYTFSRLKDDSDLADFAVRHCACDVRIDGFYEYTEHLMNVFKEAGL